AHQPRARRADAADPGAPGRDGLSVLPDDVPRRHLRQGRRGPAPCTGSRPVPGRRYRRGALAGLRVDSLRGRVQRMRARTLSTRLGIASVVLLGLELAACTGQRAPTARSSASPSRPPIASASLPAPLPTPT